MGKSSPSSQEEDNNMENINEYDKRQLMLMLEYLTSFEKKKINLSSLVGSLEFLLNALDVVDEDWEEKFLKEITVLETLNALAIIKESGEKITEIQDKKKDGLIKNSIDILKNLINEKIIKNLEL